MNRRCLPVAFALAAAACALPSYEEYSQGIDVPTSSGGGLDGGPVVLDGIAPSGNADAPSDSASDAGAPRVNLIKGNGATFDDGTCDGISSTHNVAGFRAVLSSDTVARTGARSCRVCRMPPSGPFTIDTNFLDPVPVGTYHARAWIRRPPGVLKSFPVAITLRLMAEDYTQLEQRVSDGLELTDEWQPITVDFVVTAPAPRMDTYVGAEPLLGPACFLVDDYEVWRDEI